MSIAEIFHISTLEKKALNKIFVPVKTGVVSFCLFFAHCKIFQLLSCSEKGLVFSTHFSCLFIHATDFFEC